jgi:hypothetical protein
MPLFGASAWMSIKSWIFLLKNRSRSKMLISLKLQCIPPLASLYGILVMAVFHVIGCVMTLIHQHQFEGSQEAASPIAQY